MLETLDYTMRIDSTPTFFYISIHTYVVNSSLRSKRTNPGVCLHSLTNIALDIGRHFETYF